MRKLITSPRRTSAVFIAVAAVALAGALLSSAGVTVRAWGTLTGQHTAEARALRKRAEIAAEQSGALEATSIAIHLYGLLPTDRVNIRPTNERIVQATAGTVIGEITNRSLRPGPPLPEAALEVTAEAITFTRPAAAEGALYIDIEVPVGRQAQVSLDGNVVLAAAVQEPLSIRGREIGRGANNRAAAIAHLIAPRAGVTRGAFQGPDGKHIVPFDLLRVVRRERLEGMPADTIAILEIDETGRVVAVAFRGTAPAAAASLEEALKRWRFAPYRVDGQPVPVSTLLTPEFR